MLLEAFLLSVACGWGVGGHVALNDGIRQRLGDARLVAAMVEIEALKAENDQLRSLLGLDRTAFSTPADVWEPTLFAEATGGDRATTGMSSQRMDTLFLAFPVSFKGRIVQYVGRVLRAHDDKTDLEVHAYFVILSPVLKAMHTKRLLSTLRSASSETTTAKCPSAHTPTVQLWCADPAVRSGYRRFAYGRACCVVG